MDRDEMLRVMRAFEAARLVGDAASFENVASEKLDHLAPYIRRGVFRYRSIEEAQAARQATPRA